MGDGVVRAAAGLVALLVLSSCGQDDQYVGAVATAAHTVGSCSKIATPEELYTASDVAPPVRCDEPHQTETIFAGQLDGPLAAKAERPDVEQLDTVAAERCRAVDLRSYLGARPRDSFAVNVLAKVPTRAEWSAGDRTFRCEAVPVAASGAAPQISVPLRGVLATAGSAAIRVCRVGDQQLPCDQPHTAEEVNAWLLASGSVDGAERPEQRCGPYVTEFLGGPLKEFPDLAVVAIESIVQTQRAIKCAVGRRDGQLIAGTLAQDGRK